MNEVKIYKGHPDQGGVLVEIIPSTKMHYQDDPTFQVRKEKKKFSKKVKCEFCGDFTMAQLESMTTCKKLVCLNKKKVKRLAGKAKIGGRLNGNSQN